VKIESSLFQILVKHVCCKAVKKILKQLAYPDSSRKLRLPPISKLKIKPKSGKGIRMIGTY